MESLVINAGSSSVKFQVFREETSVLSGLCEEIGSETSKLKVEFDGSKEKSDFLMKNHRAAFEKIIDVLKEKGLFEDLSVVVHRVVHGGEKFMKTEVITHEMLSELKKLIPLAPLHNPANIEGIELMEELLPGIQQVGVFDTAFHSTIPQEAYLYAVPYSWYTEHGVRRYGFHGSSHQFVIGETLKKLGKADAKIINCHLGNGASVCASVGGKSVDTSMGMTPLEGIVMGTRGGDVDPGVILHMLGEGGLSVEEVTKALNKESGLKGLSELGSDMRPLEENMETCEKSGRAMNVYMYRLVKVIGSYVAAMGGVDAICFCGGAGEKSPIIRKYVADKLKFLGVELDEDKNNSNSEGITSEGSSVKMFVVATDEELQMVRNARAVLG